MTNCIKPLLLPKKIKDRLMSKTKNILIPKLRFPEFKDCGEWEEKKLSNFIKLYRGSSPRPIKDFLTQSEKGVNWIKIGDTKDVEDFKIKKVEQKITIKGAEQSRKVSKGELILANSMSYGATYELEIDGCIYDGWFVLREYEEHYNKEFLLQLLNFDFVQSQYKKFAAGGIVKNISSDIVYNILLSRPVTDKQKELKEQQKIASCLSSLDELIETHKQKLELLKQHKKGLMQNLFPQEGEKVPKLRFKEFENSGDWEKKKFSKYIKLYRGSSPRPIKDFLTQSEKGVNWIKIGDTKNANGFIINEVEQKITIEGAEQSRKVSKGELILANSMSYGATYELGIDGYIYDGWFVLREYEEHYNKDFLLQLLNSDFVQSQYKKMAAGGIVKNISSDIVYDVFLYKPAVTDKHKELKEQKKIADCLSSLDDLITAQTEKIEQLKQHKKGLMQGLFPKIED